MSLKIIHCWHSPPPSVDVNTIRRESVAGYSWRIAYQTGEWIDGGSSMRDYPRAFDENGRKLPFLKDIIDAAFIKTADDSDLILLTNTDNVLAPDTYTQIAKAWEGGARGFYGARMDFTRIDKPLTSAEIARGANYSGKDVFGFASKWWREHRETFPDLCFAREAWDGVLYKTLEKEGFPELKFLVAHEGHLTTWCNGANRVNLPGQRHNHLLASSAFAKLGVPWKERTYGAVPKWNVDQPEVPPTYTWEGYHLGDNIIHINYLRKVALANPHRKFIHACRKEYIPQIAELAEDAKNISIISLDDKPANAISSWKNTGGFMDRHPLKTKWGQLYVSWFVALSHQLQVKNPCARIDDLLNDSPAILKPTKMSQPWDVLIINSPVGSGQFKHWTPDYFDGIINSLVASGKTVISTYPSKTGIPCTQDEKLSVAGIGNVSLKTPVIISVSTGPMFTTLNVFNRSSVRLRIILRDHQNPNEVEDFQSPDPFIPLKTREDVMQVLRDRKII
jgi:ADP-heptose:LPS heptosyltransferase